MAEKRTIELEIKENFKQVEKDLNSLDKALDNTANSARDVNKSFEDVYGDLQPLTTRMGEAEDRLYELAAAGDYTSNEYKNLLNTVGEYRKVQINTDLAVDAASMTLSQKLGGALGGVASGFELAQGSMALFGVEGENVQAALLKVQSAMALSQGLQGLKEAKTSFIALGDSAKKTAVGQSILTAATAAYTFVTSAATTGLKLFRAALISTGIGALIVGVGLLIANFEKILGLFGPLIQGFKDFGDWIGLTSFKQDEEDKKAVKRAENRIAEINREKLVREKAQKAKETAYNNEDKALGRQIDLMKAQGKDTTSLERARLKATIRYQANLQNESFAIFNQNKEKNKLILTELRAIAVREKDFTEYNKFLLSTSATQNEIAAENAAANEARKDAINQLAIFEAEVLKSRNEAQTQSVQTTQTTEKQKYDLEKENRDKRISLMADGYEKEKAIIEAKAKDAKDDLEKRNKEGIIKKTEFAEAEKLIADNLTKDLRNLDIKFNGEKLKTLAGGIEYMSRLRGKDLDAEIANSAKKIEIAKEEAEKKKEIEQEVTNAKIQMAKDGLQLVSNVTELFGRQNEKRAKIAFQVDKAAKVASAGIAGVEGTINAYKTAQGSPYTAIFPAYPIVQAGLAAAFAATNIAKIAQAKFGGSTSQGGSGSSGGGSGGGATMTPQFNVVGNNGINQLAQLQQQPVQAYVVSGEVTTAQSLDRNRVQNATL